MCNSFFILTLIKNGNSAIKREIIDLFLQKPPWETGKYSKKENNIFSHHNVQANFLFYGSDYLETSRAWIMHLSYAIPSTGLHEFDWAQVVWINPLSTSLNFFSQALMTGQQELE